MYRIYYCADYDEEDSLLEFAEGVWGYGDEVETGPDGDCQPYVNAVGLRS